ncbi:MAG: quinolinate synthase NadA [Bacteroides sp.]|nr:quinolinate synthase NadA [Eubacterium sp.]MCM1417587.1 quinolinate synthase NadA [Roseburia sp.]MCM1461702.1 quinolinate synthase NadA [Bacteroides sp.]
MNIHETQEKIVKLKKEKDFCILAHIYQNREIVEIADYVGDSFGLSKEAAKAPQKNVLMCGVRFMAETVKLLAPEKTVYLSAAEAGCPMAEQLDVDLLRGLKRQYPDYTVAAYINTTAALKTECDVCVTSVSAVKILKKVENKNILFIPDINLGQYCADRLPEKNFKLVQGGCPTHARMTGEDVDRAKAAHPDALLLVHPECTPAVTKSADYIGSTTGIIEFAKSSDRREFIIGTENSIVAHLQYECPDKRFYPLSKDCVCHNMRLTTLSDVLYCLNGEGEEIVLDDDIQKKARRCIDEMLRLG